MRNVPTSVEATTLYENLYNSTLRPQSQFGIDPIRNRENLVEFRETSFCQNDRIEGIFSELMNNNDQSLRLSLSFFINETIQ